MFYPKPILFMYIRNTQNSLTISTNTSIITTTNIYSNNNTMNFQNNFPARKSMFFLIT